MNSTNNSSSLFTTIATVATIAGVSLTALQLDVTSRFFLSPESLFGKRRQEYKYRWNKALQKAVFLKRKLYNFFAETPDELATVEWLTTNEEITAFVNSLNDKFDIVAIETSPADPRNTQELYLYLMYQNQKYQVSLVEFGMQLANKMEQELTSTTFCFVADASSGFGANVVTTIVEESKVPVTIAPHCELWMTFLAAVANSKVIPSQKLERVLFGLCRYEATCIDTKNKTILFSLPGQACLPLLVPLLQAAFPCERHVFVYSGCVHAVEYASNERRQKRVGESIDPPHLLVTTPMAYMPAKLRGYTQALSKLPIQHADIVETWMIAVDMYLRLKEEEKRNNYLPFCCKLDNLFGGDSKLACTNLLQFITGSRSRPLSEQVVDAAMSVLQDFSFSSKKLNTSSIKNVENAVFCHKSILIENKTLVDTVTPSKEWTLKSAKRISGCLCCAPEEDDDDDEEEETAENNKDDIMGIMSFATTKSKRPNYVDGKTTFAFDPTKF